MFPTFPTVLSIWGLLGALYTHMLTHTCIYIYNTICLSLSVYIYNIYFPYHHYRISLGRASAPLSAPERGAKPRSRLHRLRRP